MGVAGFDFRHQEAKPNAKLELQSSELIMLFEFNNPLMFVL